MRQPDVAAWPIEELFFRPLLTLLLAVALPGLSRRALTAVLAPRRAEHPFDQAREAYPLARAHRLLTVLEVLSFGFLGANALAPPVLALAGGWARFAFGLASATVTLASGAAAFAIDVGQGPTSTPKGRAVLALRRLAPWSLAVAALPAWAAVPAEGLPAILLTTAAGVAVFGLGIARGIVASRLFGAVRPASRRVAGLLSEACARAGLAPARALTLPTVGARFANAWAHPLTSTVLVTEALEEALDDEALSAVLAHEVDHLREPRWMSWLRVSGPAVLLTMLANMLRRVGERTELAELALDVGLFVVGVGLMVAARRVGHRREAQADAHAHADRGDEALARALTAIQGINLIPAVLGHRGTHPELYERLKAAGNEPGPRPTPPTTRAALIVALLLSGSGALGLVFVERSTRIAPEAIATTSAQSAWWRLRVDPSDGAAMLTVAWTHAARGDVRRAREVSDEAERMGAPAVQVAEARAELLAQEGDCAGAWSEFNRSLELRASEVFADESLPPLELGGWSLPPSMVELCAGE